MKFVPVENHPGLVRDVDTNAILNIDDKAHEEHRARKRLTQAKMEKERLQELRINKLENDVSELKSGITQILEILKK